MICAICAVSAAATWTVYFLARIPAVQFSMYLCKGEQECKKSQESLTKPLEMASRVENSAIRGVMAQEFTIPMHQRKDHTPTNLSASGLHLPAELYAAPQTFGDRILLDPPVR